MNPAKPSPGFVLSGGTACEAFLWTPHSRALFCRRNLSLFARKLRPNKPQPCPAFFGLENILENQIVISGCDSAAFYTSSSKRIPGCQDIFVKNGPLLVPLAKGFES
jgi:hypothetical protein